MNAKVYNFEFNAEIRQVEDAVLSVFHAVLFHRASGKIQFRHEGESPLPVVVVALFLSRPFFVLSPGSYAVGTVGYEDVDCDTVNFTYVRCMCPLLDEKLRRDVRSFVDALGRDQTSGTVSLQFYEKRKSRWPFGEDTVVWEVWTVKVNVARVTVEKQRREIYERLSEKLSEAVACVAEAVNGADYTPRVPSKRDEVNVFETRYAEVEPYLNRVVHQVGSEGDASMAGVAGVFKKIFREALAY